MERMSLCSKLKQEGISNNNNNRGMMMKQMYEYNNSKFKGSSSSSSSSWDLGNDQHSININKINGNNNWKLEAAGDLVVAAAGFSWPPRSYTCSFCKREFRSAQALGGHMNVHRRDRARLRLSPAASTRISSDNNNNSNNYIIGNKIAASGGGQFSTVNLNLDPNPSLNPNPNLSTSSLFTKFPQFTSTLPPVCPLPAANYAKSHEMKRFDHEEDVSDLIKMKASKGALFGTVDKFGSSARVRVEKGSSYDHEVLIKKGGGQFVRLDLEIGLFSQSKEELDLELRLGYT